MDGLIVKEPFALQLVTGKKDVEYRKTPLPDNKRAVDILILNGKFAIGTVQFGGDYHVVDENYHKWFVVNHKMYSPFLKYKHKNGCIIWINDVEIYE